ncbi:GNAT family N-acetyltransferase [Propionibacteriaceae bacterium Y2011]|uniref:GNAT family N-acetyltransferase n=1 Tax=Microlunatus sp. Y2014 TaxID=3418488 RepID=UPI003B4DDEB4
MTSPVELVDNAHLFDHEVTADGARDFMHREGHVLFLATTDDGTGIGFVSGVEMRHPDKSPEMFIYELGVDQAWRRQGVAKALLLALRDEAVRRGCTGMWTGAEADNEAAQATYRSIGATVDADAVIIVLDDLTAN